MKCLLLTDIPAPWREQVYERVHQQLGDAFHVAYCGRNEKRRLWTFPHGKHFKRFLKPYTFFLGGGDRFFNPGIIPLLLRHRPPVLIVFGLKDPTMMIAYLLSKLIGSTVVVFSDTWLGRDKNIGRPQRAVRKLTFRHFGHVFLGASQKTLEMYQHYNPHIRSDALFQSALCADNDYFRTCLAQHPQARTYDVMFSGRIVAGKNPLFLAEVAARVKAQRGSCRVLIIGEGDADLKEQIFQRFREKGVDYTFAGFVEHAELPKFYAQAKLLLLPTSEDCWGVVINEAMVSGTPVVTTPMTAAAYELVLHGVNGCVLRLDADTWVANIVDLLGSPEKLSAYSQAARDAVARYSFANAADGMVAAIRYAEALRA